MTRTMTDVERVQLLEASIAAHYATPRPTQGGQAARSAIIRASTLACLVRDEGPDATGAYLDNLTRDQLYALTITLAAMTPLDAVPDEVLGWVADVGDQLERESQRGRRRPSRAAA